MEALQFQICYRASYLVTLAQWWSKEGTDSWWFEQELIEISLHEWVHLSKMERKKNPKGTKHCVNGIV